jgi:mono/diheme cytochrome c family protein
LLLVVGLVLLYGLWTLRAPSPSSSTPHGLPSPATGGLSPEKMPLVTGEEPIQDMFVRAGCVVCHTIPGIAGAKGQVGPPLILGTTGPERIQDPSYAGQAKTVRQYIVESVLEPRRFVVAGYPAETMPTWYGSKLSALALQKIAAYLEQQTGPTVQ